MPAGITGIRLTKVQAAAAAALAGIAVASGFVYGPLRQEIGKKSSALGGLQAELAAVRLRSGLVPRGGASLIARSDVSAVIAEISEKGKASHLDLIALSPGEIKPAEGLDCRVMPLRMEIKGGYKELAGFLGLLDGLKTGGLVTVEQLSAVPEKEEARLKVGLTLNLYLADDDVG